MHCIDKRNLLKIETLPLFLQKGCRIVLDFRNI